ncbi:MAG: ThaI family type II restriction endonuclease [Patescibacteria group bacterium]
MDYLESLFNDSEIVKRIRAKLPTLFQLAEMDSSRAGKIGMEVGSVRERVIIALLMYKFGEENVKTDLPITEPETDVILYEKPISIKTVSGNLGGVKLIWTVDAKKVLEFSNTYYPSKDMLLVQIKWSGVGYLYHFPVSSQTRVFDKIGRKKYIKLPKKGTNPRGVEITKKALEMLAKDSETQKIEIAWERGKPNQSVYDRWVELWAN